MFAGSFATAVLVTALGACSDTNADSGGGAGSADCVAQAEAKVEAAMQPMEIEKPQPLDTSSMSGKTVAIVSWIQASTLNAVANEALQKALEEVGISSTLFDAKARPDLAAQGVNSAIAQDVDAIIMFGVSPSLVANPLEDAKAAGIPVLDLVQEAQPDTVAAVVAMKAEDTGTLSADYALAKTECKLDGAVLYAAGDEYNTAYNDAIVAEVKALCGDQCELESTDFPIPTFATSVPTISANMLRRNPNMNFLMTPDPAVPMVLQSAKTVGIDVPVIGWDGGQLQPSIEGSGQVADLSWMPHEVVGWIAADSVMRVISGSPENVYLPQQIFDESNWGEAWEFSTQFPKLVGFEDEYRQAWGVS